MQQKEYFYIENVYKTFNDFCNEFRIEKIKDSPLFQEAMTHSSASKKKNYERMEFLGDSILNFCIARMLFEALSDKKEGILSKEKSFLCSRKICRLVAKEIKLDTQILTSKRQKFNTDFIIADIVESMLCCIYYEYGIEKVHQIVEKLFYKYINSNNVTDPKMMLQELTQKRYKKLPEYSTLSKQGTEHEPIFTISVKCNKFYAEGNGKNKKEAEKQAAQNMLLLLNGNK